jgi:hypothetical protein
MMKDNFAQQRLPHLRRRPNKSTRPHRDDPRGQSTVDFAFHRFEVTAPYFAIRKIAREFGIPPSAVCNWRHKWIQGQKSRPGKLTAPSLHHRICNDEQEVAMAGYVAPEFISHGEPFADEDFQGRA